MCERRLQFDGPLRSDLLLEAGSDIGETTQLERAVASAGRLFRVRLRHERCHRGGQLEFGAHFDERIDGAHDSVVQCLALLSDVPISFDGKLCVRRYRDLLDSLAETSEGGRDGPVRCEKREPPNGRLDVLFESLFERGTRMVARMGDLGRSVGADRLGLVREALGFRPVGALGKRNSRSEGQAEADEIIILGLDALDDLRLHVRHPPLRRELLVRIRLQVLLEVALADKLQNGAVFWQGVVGHLELVADECLLCLIDEQKPLQLLAPTLTVGREAPFDFGRIGTARDAVPLPLHCRMFLPQLCGRALKQRDVWIFRRKQVKLRDNAERAVRDTL
mmetsp:Transcript_43213/g.133494  ORF Transcript_43213/g.133494 Transcript_43213/m.133494 type:complete len:335 (-) Transcript_43213:1035-2039(-)